MIELLLKLIDRLIDLQKYRTERLRKTFQDLLDPIFKDLMSIHADYIRMFEEVNERLKAIPDDGSQESTKKILEIAESLRLRRVEFEPVREKLAAITRELGGGSFGRGPKIQSKEAEEFVASVIQYFPQVNLGSNTSRASALVLALRGNAALTATQVDRNKRNLSEIVNSTIEDCRKKWSAVCDSYARLQIVAGAA